MSDRPAPTEKNTETQDLILYGLDEPRVFFPRGWEPNASKAKYRGWKELDTVGMVDCGFDPRVITAHVRYAYRVLDDPYAELTHRLTTDPMVPGAYKVWVVEVDPNW